VTLLCGAWTTLQSTIRERPYTAPCFKCMNGAARSLCQLSGQCSDLLLLAFGSSGVQGTWNRFPRAREGVMRPPVIRKTTRRAWSTGPSPRRSTHNPIGPVSERGSLNGGVTMDTGDAVESLTGCLVKRLMRHCRRVGVGDSQLEGFRSSMLPPLPTTAIDPAIPLNCSRTSSNWAD
jgi:hypothetical protein